jgi:two-component system sensor histidine kinase VanS
MTAEATPSLQAGASAAARISWRPRLTIRARLTLTYAGLVTGCGAVLIGTVWAFMRFVPSYAITAARGPHDGDGLSEMSAAPAISAPAAPDTITAQTSTISVTSASDFLTILLVISMLALLFLGSLSGLIGWIVAGRVLKPLQAINEAANLAANGSLDHRVGLEGPRDEIRNLSDTFDRMLGALELSFAAHRRFAANASHELRTPLATTQTMIDVGLADPDADTGSLRELARRIHTVNRANMHTVESLLGLASIGQRPLPRVATDLRQVAVDAVGVLRADALESNVTVTVDQGSSDAPGDDVMALVSPVLVRQAVTNLVQNAIRHNIAGGTVRIRVKPRPSSVIFTVSNTGNPVPAHLVESLTEPFVRGAGRIAAAGSTRGTGLGLAIVSSIAIAENGELQLQPNPGGGLTARLTLPR